MRIRLFAIGNKMPAWVSAGYNEYAQRLNHDVKLELCELELPKRSKTSDIARLKEAEAELIGAQIKNDYIVALDVLGAAWSTEHVATHMSRWQQLGRDIALIIGGPDGIAPSLLLRADQKWSLSMLTLPHPLVRIVVAEALYRAHSVLHHHPYHRA